MARQITSMAQLNAQMDSICKNLCEQLQQRVYEVLNLFIKQYYDEWEGEYKRTNAFLNSAFKAKLVKIANGYETQVYIDTDSMNNYVNATGFQIAEFANKGTHGGFYVNTDTHVWDDTIENTIGNGDLVTLAKSFLIGYGLTIV